MKNRIKELRENKGISQAALAKYSGVVRSAMCQYESGARQIPDAIKIKLADYFGVSVDYLLGRTDKKESDPFEEKYPSEDIFYLPIYATVAAGFNKYINENDFDGEMQEVPTSIARGHRKDDLFVFEVMGDSMVPKFLPGDRVLVVRTSSVDSGDTAIISYNGYEEGTIKKVQYEPGCDYVDLIPANPKYDPIRLQGDDLETCRVVGKVIYLFRKI